MKQSFQGQSRSRVFTSCMTRCMISNGNHVKFARFVLLAFDHRKNKNTTFIFFFVQCTKEQSWKSVFVLSRIIKAFVKFRKRRPSPPPLGAVTLYLYSNMADFVPCDRLLKKAYSADCFRLLLLQDVALLWEPKCTLPNVLLWWDNLIYLWTFTCNESVILFIFHVRARPQCPLSAL